MRLHLGGLAPDVRDDEVAARFASFGTVHGVEVMRDDMAACRGFAYVDLESTEEQMEKCLKVYSGSKWRGRTLSIGLARPSYRERLEVTLPNG